MCFISSFGNGIVSQQQKNNLDKCCCPEWGIAVTDTDLLFFFFLRNVANCDFRLEKLLNVISRAKERYIP